MSNALESGWLVAIIVAVLPAVGGVVGNLVTREARTPRHVRNLDHLAGSLAKMPVGSRAHESVSDLIADYSAHVKAGLLDSRKLNKANVGFTVFLLLVTLFSMYGLITWVAGTTDSGWNVVAIPVTVVVGLLLFLLNVAAVATWYNPPSERRERQ